MAEILMPASAVGVSCTFAAPVGDLFHSVAVYMVGQHVGWGFFDSRGLHVGGVSSTHVVNTWGGVSSTHVVYTIMGVVRFHKNMI